MLNKINGVDLNPKMFKKTQFKFRKINKSLVTYNDI